MTFDEFERLIEARIAPHPGRRLSEGNGLFGRYLVLRTSPDDLGRTVVVPADVG